MQADRQVGPGGTGAPGGIVMPVLPLKVSARSLPAAMPAPPWRSATWASPMRKGVVPSSLEMRIRTRVPPMVVCTIRRKVWLLKVWVCAASGGPAGAVPQVPTHCSVCQALDCAMAGSCGSATPASTMAARKPRRRAEFGEKDRLVKLRFMMSPRSFGCMMVRCPPSSSLDSRL
jgi:hypothetical protein